MCKIYLFFKDVYNLLISLQVYDGIKAYMLCMKYECHTLTSSTGYARYQAVMTVAAINENSYFHSCKVQCASEGFYC